MRIVFRILAALLTAGAIATGQEALQPDPAELVKSLASESYKEREAASAALWALGETGVEELLRGAASDDPEVAYRARRLVRRIQTGITPETPREVVDLVERYYRGELGVKRATLDKLKDMEAYSQVLRLYRFEPDPDVREDCLELVEEVVLPALRQELDKEDYESAEAILRVAPETDENLRRRAALSRVRGRAGADLAAAEAAGDQEWKLALLRAGGDIPGSLAAARALGREDLVGALSLFEGDPVPFLNWYAGNNHNPATMRLHAEIVRDRWLGEEDRAAKFAKSLAKNVSDESEDQRSAMVSLLLNGYLDEALPIMRRNDDFRDLLYAYHETLEDPVRAIAVFGYQGTGEEKKKWVAEHMRKINAHWSRASDEWNTVLTVAGFLMARGEREAALEIARQLKAAVMKQGGEEAWLEFLGELGDMRGSFYELAFGLAAEELGDDAEAGDAVAMIAALFREGDTALRHWERLKGEKDLTDAQRILLLAGIYGMVEQPAAKVQAVLQKFLDQAMALEGEKRRQALADLVEPAAYPYRDDAAAVLVLLELLAEIDGVGRWTNSLAIYYGYMSRWEKAEEVLKLALDTNPRARRTMATLAAVKMRLGKNAEARELLKEAEIHALDEGEWLMALAEIFERRNLDGEAEDYWRRLLMTNSPSPRNREWLSACAEFAKHAKNHGHWRVAAAFMEVEALFDIRDRATYVNPVLYLRKRFGADLLRGMALHEEGKEADARALLDRSFRILMGDGVLADDFFPLLREAGFIEEHDKYFEEAYARILESIKAYPRTHNTYNSAAWLASRSMRRLDEAERMVAKALESRPRQAAYLDTMAEVWFARRNRDKAVEWSTKAVEDSEHAGHSITGGADLRRQFERFKTGKFPAP